MIIDNFTCIYNWLRYLNEGDFYWIQIYCRKKDGNNVSDKIVIKNYIIFNINELKKYESEIKMLCANNNARAYIWVNPRSYRLFQINLLKHTAASIENNNYSVYRLVDKAIVDSKSPNYEKVWILDIDSTSRELIDKYEDIICKCNCKGNCEYDLLETVNGYHLLSHRFNITKFNFFIQSNHLQVVDIHKDNPTLLYYERKTISSDFKTDGLGIVKPNLIYL